jgi:CDP-paratose 2-epimerase
MNGKFLVTGGAGFIGTNLVNNLLSDGCSVTILDSLARKGTQSNLAWLQRHHYKRQLEFVRGDVRDFAIVKSAATNADAIYHLAGQVAVTSSVCDPRLDFEVNTLGTFNVLEAARLSGRKPIVVFTSTNKVYGEMDSVATIELDTRYAYRDLPYGVSESQPVDFHSPYGCSKGAADHYVRDYARIYGLRTIVFRMSCIYGPRQFGSEDQGWLAHFMIASETAKPITIYGNGKQVRDVLFIDDLVKAFRFAVDKIGVTAGQVYNIGGGPKNTIAVWREFGPLLSRWKAKKVPVRFDKWRAGDQPCYVSDIRKAHAHMRWQPTVDTETGIRRLWEWVKSNKKLFDTLQAIGQLGPTSKPRQRSRERRMRVSRSLLRAKEVRA